jgi:hypothetical protein
MTMTARPIPHRPAPAGPDDPLVFATAADGSPAGFAITGERSHLLLAGAAGSGLTAACRVISLEAARRGMDVRACCSREHDARQLRNWPNITAAGSPEDTIALVGATFGDMMTRCAEIETGRQPAARQPVLLVIDEYSVWAQLAASYWAQAWFGGGQGVCPAFGQLAALLVLGQAARISVAVAISASASRPPSFPPGVLDAIGTRAALGRLDEETAWALFGGRAADTDVPHGVNGAATIFTPAGRGQAATVHWLPAPAGPLSDGETRLLRDMLPPDNSRAITGATGREFPGVHPASRIARQPRKEPARRPGARFPDECDR